MVGTCAAERRAWAPAYDNGASVGRPAAAEYFWIIPMVRKACAIRPHVVGSPPPKQHSLATAADLRRHAEHCFASRPTISMLKQSMLTASGVPLPNGESRKASSCHPGER